MTGFDDVCNVFLDAVLEGEAVFADFRQWLGRRPWAEELLALEKLAWEIGLSPGYSQGMPNDTNQCVVCGEKNEYYGCAACGGCGRIWCCFKCLTWDEDSEQHLCPLCEADRLYVRGRATAGPLRNSALADALAKMS